MAMTVRADTGIRRRSSPLSRSATRTIVAVSTMYISGRVPCLTGMAGCAGTAIGLSVHVSSGLGTGAGTGLYDPETCSFLPPPLHPLSAKNSAKTAANARFRSPADNTTTDLRIPYDNPQTCLIHLRKCQPGLVLILAALVGIA